MSTDSRLKGNRETAGEGKQKCNAKLTKTGVQNVLTNTTKRYTQHRYIFYQSKYVLAFIEMSNSNKL